MPAIGFRIARASAFASLLVFTNLTAAGIDRLARDPGCGGVEHENRRA